MQATSKSESNAAKNRTTAERKSDRELVVTRVVNAPARLVYQAWSQAELFSQWWVPKSSPLTLISCEIDARTGGKYRLVFRFGEHPPMEFFGTYVEVVPNSRMVWTNEEAGEGGQVSTVTFTEQDGQTLVVLHELYPSKEALDEAMASGSQSGTLESFEQLEQFVAAQVAAG